MTPEEFHKFITDFGEAFNRRDLAAIGDFYAEDAVRHWPPWGVARGREQIMKTRESLFQAMPDMSWKLHHWDVSLKLHHKQFGGDYGFVEWTVMGTQTGPFTTPLVNVPPTGKKVRLSGTTVFEFDAQGKIVEERSYFDVMSLLGEFGLQVTPAPLAAFPGIRRIRSSYLTKGEALAEIKEHFGTVPEWLSKLPEGELEHDWALISSVELGETAIPNKYKELMGLAAASALRCGYCTFFHAEIAKLFGASEDEIREAVLMAKLTSGLSAYLSGGQFDHDRFKKETAEMVSHVRKARTRKAA
ncbi:MAG: ester cyclase [Chloroflexi bacterium]|nr:ester cyclase [Chloroflexota bacterium]